MWGGVGFRRRPEFQGLMKAVFTAETLALVDTQPAHRTPYDTIAPIKIRAFMPEPNSWFACHRTQPSNVVETALVA